MSSPALSSGTFRPVGLFEDLWRQLRDSHQNAVQDLEEKVNKLKKERCLDAQKLEVFYNRNQQLKEQNKSLQEAVSVLEERPPTGQCEKCEILSETLRKNQEENLCLIARMKSERNSLEDTNRKLQSELQKLKTSRSEQQQQQQSSPPEQEEGIIPDSPILPSSLPAANKLKKRRNLDKRKYVRYAEVPLPKASGSLFNEVKREPEKTEVLVPNTCELDSSQTTNCVNPNGDLEVAETCALELLSRPHVKVQQTAGQQSSSKSSWKFAHLKPTLIHSPDSERSPSLLPRVKSFSEDDSVNKAKRKKEDIQPEDKQGETSEPEGLKRSSCSLSNQSFKTETEDRKVHSADNTTSSQRLKVSCLSPAFKKPHVSVETREAAIRKKINSELHLNASQKHHADADRNLRVEPSWSIDPGLALSMYESQKDEDCAGDLQDTDVTWVSHSVLQRQDREDSDCGLGQRANDSLDMMFETTANGEYKSYNSTHLDHSDEDEEEEGEEEVEDGVERDPDETTLSQFRENRARRPAFAHVAVIRNKEERRKLKGTTCKECEVYYAHLPEEEKQKKLSSCSRHRFLYIPPCTPENFWEVGFPSTQTCIERGYIHEETNPQARTRRRQPYNALFSPKRKKQQQQQEEEEEEEVKESNNSFSL